jgi:hypothetical protein
MKKDDRKWTRSLRMAILTLAVVEAVGIALAVWKSMAKG